MSAIVAKALNSTLGSENFKSFDKILADDVRLVGSSDVFFVYDDVWNEPSATSRETKGISFELGGAINVYMSLGTGASECDITATYNGGKSITVRKKTGASPMMRINVKKGDVVKFKAAAVKSGSVSYGVNVNELYIGATVVQGSKYCTIS